MAHDVATPDIDPIADIQQRLKMLVGEERISAWIPSHARWEVDTQESYPRLMLTVPNQFMADCLKEFLFTDLKRVCQEVLGGFAGVIVKADPNLTSPALEGGSGKLSLIATSVAEGPSERPTRTILKQTATSPQVEEHGLAASGYGDRALGIQPVLVPGKQTVMRFDYWAEFIDGATNRVAKTAALMAIEQPGKVTPLLLHGPSGVGKTHLGRAMADQLRVCHRMRRVVYLTGEQFTIDFTESARGSGFASFRKKYRDLDALILDDVHFLLGKTGTLIELRNTIDNLLNHQRQVVLMSDRSWNELSGLGAELHGRLSGGMVCALEPLDEVGRIELLSRLCQRHHVDASPGILENMVRLAGNDARVLHGIAYRLMAGQRMRGRALEYEEALECCQDLLRASQPIVRITDIEKVVCDAFGLERRSLQTKCKSKTVSQPRMLAMFLARKYTRAAYSEIGSYFGKRQHSTVISAQKKVEDWIANDSMVDHARGSVSIRDILRSLEVSLQVG